MPSCTLPGGRRSRGRDSAVRGRALGNSDIELVAPGTTRHERDGTACHAQGFKISYNVLSHVSRLIPKFYPFLAARRWQWIFSPRYAQLGVVHALYFSHWWPDALPIYSEV